MSLRVDARLHETFLAAVLQCCCRDCLLDASPTLLYLSAGWRWSTVSNGRQSESHDRVKFTHIEKG